MGSYTFSGRKTLVLTTQCTFYPRSSLACNAGKDFSLYYATKFQVVFQSLT